MSYQVGVDLGTTYTAAAVFRDDRASIFSLGGRSDAIPSVVLLREDETVLTGEAAVRRAMTEPERVAREFKRRLGDTTPIIVGGTPYSAEALMARLLRYVLQEIETREGGPPDRVAVSHPANWGPFKIDLLRQAIRMADLDDSKVVLLSEPEAAAISYASQERVEPGEVIAVYDLGGGTFDAAVLRRTVDGFEIIGQPEGIERLGGIDFDAAVFAHVVRSLDGAIEALDPDDPSTVSAVSRLRQDCVDAKEALSSDTDATIPVLLPGLQTEVRLTRSEFESIIRPSLVDSIEALRRGLRSAGVEPSDVARVLLVGGSSRVPLIGQMVSSELGRPVAVDAHPKHAIALGAALAAGGAHGAGNPPPVIEPAPASPTPTPPIPEATPAPVQPVEPPTPAPMPNPTVPVPEVTAPMAAEPPVTAAQPVVPERPVPTDPRPTIPLEVPAAAPAVAPTPSPAAAPAAAAPMVATSAGESPPVSTPPTDTGSSGKSRLPLLAALGVVAALLVGGGFYAISQGGDDGGDTATATSQTTVDEQAAEEESTTTTVAETTTTVVERTDADIASDLSDAAGDFDQTLEVAFADGVATVSGQAVDEEDEAAILAAIEGVEGVEEVDRVGLEVLAPEFRCTELIMSQPRWMCLDSAEFDGTTLTATFTSESGDQVFNTGGGFHVHFFDGAGDPVTQGVAGDASTGGGNWQVWDLTPLYESTKWAGTDIEVICGRIATPSHTLESLDSGNCWPVVRTDG